MKVRWQTGRWVAAVVALALFDGALRWPRADTIEAMPSLAGFDASRARRVTVGRVDEPLVLERDGDSWRLVAPSRGPADGHEVEALVAGLANGIPFRSRVDDGSYERYGLDGGVEVRVEVHDGAEVLSSLYVGADAGGGTTFVRLPDAPEVYRARIGGRARFDRPAAGWRDRRITDLDPSSVVSFALTTAGGVTSARRVPGGWVGEQEPVDVPTLDGLVVELAHLRATEVVATDRGVAWDGPGIALATPSEGLSLQFGRAGASWFVRRDEDPTVFRLTAPWIDALSSPSVLRDRTIWVVAPDRIRALTVTAPGRVGRLERSADGLRIVRPARVDVEPGRAAAVLQWIAAPRVVRWEKMTSEAAGFSPTHRWTIETDDGVRTLEIGASEGDRAWVRDASVPDRVGFVEPRVVALVESMFGG